MAHGHQSEIQRLEDEQLLSFLFPGTYGNNLGNSSQGSQGQVTHAQHDADKQRIAMSRPEHNPSVQSGYHSHTHPATLQLQQQRQFGQVPPFQTPFISQSARYSDSSPVPRPPTSWRPVNFPDPSFAMATSANPAQTRSWNTTYSHERPAMASQQTQFPIDPKELQRATKTLQSGGLNERSMDRTRALHSRLYPQPSQTTPFGTIDPHVLARFPTIATGSDPSPSVSNGTGTAMPSWVPYSAEDSHRAKHVRPRSFPQKFVSKQTHSQPPATFTTTNLPQSTASALQKYQGKRPREGNDVQSEDNFPAGKRHQAGDNPLCAEVAPNGQAFREHRYHLNPAAQKHYTRIVVEEISLAEAEHVAEYDPTNIARDVLLAADKHPSEIGLNHHLMPLRKHFAGTRANLDKIPWHLIDSFWLGQTRQRAAPHRPPIEQPDSQSPAPAVSAVSSAPRPLPPPDSAHSPSPQATIPQAIPAPQPTSVPQSTSIPQSTSVPQPTSVPHPISIPHPAVDSLPQSNLPPNTPPPVIISIESHSPENSPVQPSEPHKSREQIALESKRQKTPNSKTPVSPQTQTSRIPTPQVVIETPRKMTQRRGAGRPRKTDKSEQESYEQAPTEYQVFRCGMIDCEAELHNLAFLQTHCLKVHIPHNLTCQWKGCTDQTLRPAADMWDHTRQKHIKDIAWELGDGPAVPSPGELRSKHSSSRES